MKANIFSIFKVFWKSCLIVVILIGLFTTSSYGQDETDIDISEIAEACRNVGYITEFLTFKGMPLNLDCRRKVLILVNHGYIVGYSLDRNQPVWAAYYVSKARQDVNYERPLFFHDDLRLPESSRIGTDTFEGYDRGHMVPNYAINKQLGRLAQMETFLMSNMCPQKGDLNREVWADLERKIIDEYAQDRKHIWIICGPIFPDNPDTITRDQEVKVAIPTEFYMILINPKVWPYTVDKIDFMALKFPQNPDPNSLDDQYLTTIDDLEALTNLNFFPRLTADEQEEVENKKASSIW
jgi:endonuclease G